MGTMTTLFGCAGAPRTPLDTYAKRHDVLELDLFGAKQKLKVKDATLRKWRKEAGPRLAFSLVAPPTVSAVKPGPLLDEALEQLLEAQRILHARFILLATPVEVTPAALPRERLAKVVDRIRKGLGEAAELTTIAWLPRGVWEPEEAAAFARKLGVALAADPLADPHEPFWDRSLTYIRLVPVGGRGALPPSRLRAIADLLAASHKDVEAAKGAAVERVVIVTTPRASADLKRLRTLVKQLTGATERGGGRIISPRGRTAASLLEEEE